MHPSDWNHRQTELAARLHAWRKRAFPGGCASLYVDGCELVFLDADIAAMLTAAITKGPLRSQAARALAGHTSELRNALPHIPADGVGYFTELLSMAELALMLADHTH